MPAAKPAAKKKDQKIIMQGVWACFEETLQGHTGKPEKLLAPPKPGKRGPFVQTVQSIYAGAIDARESARMLEQELAPFVDGASLATALRDATPDEDHDGYLSDLVDQFVIRAMDELSRGLLALALDRPKDVPATCAAYLPLLQERVAEARALLEG